MPPALMRHASVPGVTTPSHQQREDTDVPHAAVAPRTEPPVCPTDDEARVPRAKAFKDKRSLEYVWRSGVAGGLAGCAVRGSPLLSVWAEHQDC